MKLSEAIRLGAAMKPQAFGEIEKDGKTCARGAATDALGLPLTLGGWFEANQTCGGWAYEIKDGCPVCGAVDSVAALIAFHLNDSHRWTRERIADWVELHEITQGGNMNEETKEITIAIDVEELEQKIAPGELTWPFGGGGGWGR